MLRFRTLICVLFPTLVTAVPCAIGAETGGDDKAPVLLQFDPGTAVWTIIVFLIVFGLLAKFAWKPILAALKQREDFIRDSIEGAKRERAEAERLLMQYTERIEKARVEATAIVEEGKRDAEATRRRIHDDARKEAEEMIARARREIGIARDDAVHALADRTLDLATLLAGKIMAKQLNAEDHRALLEESIAEMTKVQP